MPRSSIVMRRAELAVAIPPERLRELGLDKKRKKSIKEYDADPEHAAQREFFEWCRDPDTLARWPQLDDAFAVPNFNLLGRKWGKYFNDEGRKKGQLDIVIPHGHGGYFGCYLETKSERGKLSPEQRARAIALARAGNKVYVCHSADTLKKCARQYLTWLPTRITHHSSGLCAGMIPTYDESDITEYK